jgi:alkylation response protein AidB-like acyl-CoA dehydrogenase
MQFAYNEDQILLRASVDRFVESRYGLAERKRHRAEPIGYSLANWQELADLGLLGLMFSADDGGLGAGARDITAVMESLGNGMVVEPVLEEVVVAGRILADLGSPAQKREWVPKIVKGSAHCALAHFEHTARFNLADVRTRAQSRSGRWVLNGDKSVVPWASAANLWIVSAREQGDSDDPNGVGFFLVPADAAGIKRRDFLMADGGHASSISFRGAVADARLAGGFDEFSRCIELGRLAAGAEMIGIMSTMFDSTLDYLRTRKQFGVTLASFQAIQHRLAGLYVRLEQARSQVCRAALFFDGGNAVTSTIAGMKSYVGRAALELGESCVHLHGGIGMSDELAIGYGFKRLLILANLFGDPDSELVRFARLRSGSRENPPRDGTRVPE